MILGGYWSSAFSGIVSILLLPRLVIRTLVRLGVWDDRVLSLGYSLKAVVLRFFFSSIFSLSFRLWLVLWTIEMRSLFKIDLELSDWSFMSDSGWFSRYSSFLIAYSIFCIRLRLLQIDSASKTFVCCGLAGEGDFLLPSFMLLILRETFLLDVNSWVSTTGLIFLTKSLTDSWPSLTI